MMAKPLGFRVSGLFRMNSPIKKTKGRPSVGLPVYMRGDYYVVPPNTAHVGVGTRVSLACAHAPGPDYIKDL